MTRTIQTAAELDALPFPSAVAFPGYGDWHKIRDGRWMCDDGDVLTSGGLALVANGELAMTGDPSAPVLVVSDAAVEAAARALRIEEVGDSAPPGFAARQWDNGSANREKPMRLACAALSAALPHLTAPSATREDVARTLDPQSWDSPVEFGEDAQASLQAARRGRLLHAADDLFARFTITPRTDR